MSFLGCCSLFQKLKNNNYECLIVLVVGGSVNLKQDGSMLVVLVLDEASVIIEHTDTGTG